MTIPKNEYAVFYETYISKAVQLNKGLIESLQSSLVTFFEVLAELPEEKHQFAYADGKWTIKELISHMIETERIMAYRALRVSRKDKVNLASFNENDFVANSNANAVPYIELLKEFSLVRKASIAMFKTFNDEMLTRIGTASNTKISTRALGFILTGHVLHHLGVIKERYL